MAKIINTSKEYKLAQAEKTELKTFGEYNEILDYLYALTVKPNKATIWKYFDKWMLQINYKQK